MSQGRLVLSVLPARRGTGRLSFFSLVMKNLRHYGVIEEVSHGSDNAKELPYGPCRIACPYRGLPEDNGNDRLTQYEALPYRQKDNEASNM